MKLKSLNQKKEALYPSLNEYSKLCRNICGIALAAGITGTALNANAEETGKEKPAEEVKTNKKDEEAKLKKTVILLASKLGDDKFKVRQEATLQLIAIGKKKNKEGKTPFKAIVLEEMKKLLKNDDPEVAERAKKITKALEVKTDKRKGNPPGMRGEMPAGLIMIE